MGKILCLDFGDVRIGIAISDITNTIAQSLCYIKRIGYKKDIKAISDIYYSYNCSKIILGLPMLMSGVEGLQAEKTRAFGNELIKAGFDIEYQDERLSSVFADNLLIEADISRKNRKQYVDKIAASIILQTWLDKNNKK